MDNKQWKAALEHVKRSPLARHQMRAVMNPWSKEKDYVANEYEKNIMKHYFKIEVKEES